MPSAFDDAVNTVRRQVSQNESPHGSKLVYQLRILSRLSGTQHQALRQILPAYLELIAALRSVAWDSELNALDEAVSALNRYFAILRADVNDVFVRQADFKTSVVPEFMIGCFRELIKLVGLDLDVSGQRDVGIELSFDPRKQNALVLKRQRVDVCILRRATITVDEKGIPGFFIPIVAIECKTNFDKNMIGGVEHSVTSLKRTFPECLYIATAEWSDFDVMEQNYASTDIDEIYVLRTQRRSEFRRSGIAMDIQLSVVHDCLVQVLKHLLTLGQPKRNLKARMRSGMLIGDLATVTEKA